MRTIAIVNQKGGCGKTTVSINLASALAELGKKVLLVDMDAQSHCAVGLAVPEEQIEQSIYDVLISKSRNEPMRLTEILWQIGERLELAPASIDLSAFEQQMAGIAERECCLRDVLAAVTGEYDFCVIDCPPAVGLLTFNALRAATDVIVPVETGYFALHGLSKQLETLSILCKRCQQEVSVRVLASMYDIRTKMAREILAELRSHFSDRMFRTVVNFNTKITEAASFGQPVNEYDPASKGQQDFKTLAQEVIDASESRQAKSKRLVDSLADQLESIGASANELLEIAQPDVAGTGVHEVTAASTPEVARAGDGRVTPESKPGASQVPAGGPQIELPRSAGGAVEPRPAAVPASRAGAVETKSASSPSSGAAASARTVGSVPATAGRHSAAEVRPESTPPGGRDSAATQGRAQSAPARPAEVKATPHRPDAALARAADGKALQNRIETTPAADKAATQNRPTSAPPAAVAAPQASIASARPAATSGSTAPGARPTTTSNTPGPRATTPASNAPAAPATIRTTNAPVTPATTAPATSSSTASPARPAATPNTPATPATAAPATAPATTAAPTVPATTAPTKGRSFAEVLRAADAKLSDYYGVNQIRDAVVFVTLYPRARSVQIAGDFNNWQPAATPMVRIGETGVWQAKMKLPHGTYRYRLVVDGQWQQDPYNERTEVNPYGELNSVVEIQ